MVGMWRGAAIGCLLAGAWQLLLLLFLWHRVISPEVVEDLIKSKRKARRPDRSSAGRATIVDADGASSAGSAIVPHGSSSHAEGDVGARRRARERERRRRSLRKGFILWQQSLRGMVDLATDLLFLYNVSHGDYTAQKRGLDGDIDGLRHASAYVCAGGAARGGGVGVWDTCAA